MAHRITIAGGTSTVAQGLASRLTEGFSVRRVSSAIAPADGAWRADLTSIAQAEVACASTQTLVVLARASRTKTWKLRGAADDVDRLLADSLARAAQRCAVGHLILFACDGNDVREPLLRASGVPVSVLRGGGPDPAAQLEALVRRGPGPDVESEPWSGAPPHRDAPAGFASVQRFARPPGWSAARLGTAYFRWLAREPGVRVESSADAENVWLLGVKVLVLRRLNGQAEPDSAVWDVLGGALARPGGRLELRALLDGQSATMHLTGFRPTLPGPLYAVTQAMVHERQARRFGEWLATQPSPVEVAAPSGT